MARRRSGPYHHGELRPALVAAARAEVAKVGHARVSVRAVAAATGVTHVAAAHHFGNREGLLAAVAVAAFAELTDVLRAAGAQADPRRGFRELGLAYLGWAAANAGLYRLAFASGGWRTVEHPSLRAAAAHLVDVVADVVRRGQDAGVHRRGPPGDLALFAWSAVHGAAMVSLDNPRLVRDLGRDADHLSRIVLEGIFAGVGVGR